MSEKIECRWCHQEYEPEDIREVMFFGRQFRVCEDDFQLFWRLFGGVNAICKHLKAAWATRK